MINTIEALRDNQPIGEFYKAAFVKWRDLLKNLDKTTLSDLATAISEAQFDYFERQCGGRAMGQEIMAWTGIAYFHTSEDGFGDDIEQARKLYDAMQLSHISLDAKVHAEKAAISFDLFEGLEEAEAEM